MLSLQTAVLPPVPSRPHLLLVGHTTLSLEPIRPIFPSLLRFHSPSNKWLSILAPSSPGQKVSPPKMPSERTSSSSFRMHLTGNISMSNVLPWSTMSVYISSSHLRRVHMIAMTDISMLVDRGCPPLAGIHFRRVHPWCYLWHRYQRRVLGGGSQYHKVRKWTSCSRGWLHDRQHRVGRF